MQHLIRSTSPKLIFVDAHVTDVRMVLETIDEGSGDGTAAADAFVIIANPRSTLEDGHVVDDARYERGGERRERWLFSFADSCVAGCCTLMTCCKPHPPSPLRAQWEPQSPPCSTPPVQRACQKDVSPLMQLWCVPERKREHGWEGAWRGGWRIDI